MPTGKIAFVVGHAHWGKSLTLRALTNDEYHVKKVRIDNVEFFIRRMSNDDRLAGYVDFMKSVSPANKPFLIAALCPNFHDAEASTESILTSLGDKGYQLYFWVIEHQFGTVEVVTTQEIQHLRTFGTVEVYSARSDAVIRSESFSKFVSSTVLVD